MTESLALSSTNTEADDRIAAAVAAQGPRLRAFVRRQVADLTEVDDIVQDAFVELISAYRLMEPVVHVAAWLQRVARNRIIDHFRRRSHHDRLIDSPWFQDLHGNAGAPSDFAELEAPESVRPDSSYERDVMAEQLVAALNDLPAEQRAVYVAHELDGRSYKDLAAETGTRVNTLLSRKHAAVLYLRRRLKDMHAAMAD